MPGEQGDKMNDGNFRLIPPPALPSHPCPCSPRADSPPSPLSSPSPHSACGPDDLSLPRKIAENNTEVNV